MALTTLNNVDIANVLDSNKNNKIITFLKANEDDIKQELSNFKNMGGSITQYIARYAPYFNNSRLTEQGHKKAKIKKMIVGLSQLVFINNPECKGQIIQRIENGDTYKIIQENIEKSKENTYQAAITFSIKDFVDNLMEGSFYLKDVETPPVFEVDKYLCTQFKEYMKFEDPRKKLMMDLIYKHPEDLMEEIEVFHVHGSQAKKYEDLRQVYEFLCKVFYLPREQEPQMDYNKYFDPNYSNAIEDDDFDDDDFYNYEDYEEYDDYY